MQKMSIWESKSVVAIVRELLYRGGLKHRFGCIIKWCSTPGKPNITSFFTCGKRTACAFMLRIKMDTPLKKFLV